MTVKIGSLDVELSPGVQAPCIMARAPTHAWMDTVERAIALGGKPVAKLYLGMAGLRDYGALYREIDVDSQLQDKEALDFGEAMGDQLKQVSGVK